MSNRYPNQETEVTPQRETVVEQRPAQRTVIHHYDDPVATAHAASELIRTIVGSIVILVLLFVGLWALHVYLHLF